MSNNDELKGKVEKTNEDGWGLGLVPGESEAGLGSGSGLRDAGRLGSGNGGGSGDEERSGDARGSGDATAGQEGEKEELRASRNRDGVVGKSKGKFDKEKHPLVKSGHWFRKDHLKLYKIHAALKGCSRQELINKALEYYKVNVLQKSEAQKHKEAGQEELGI